MTTRLSARRNRDARNITEDVFRETALPRGLVDVTVRAVSEVWS